MLTTRTHLRWGLLLGGLLALTPAACGSGGATGTGGASSSTSSTTGATTGSGGSGPLAACDVPPVRPSNGACYTPPPDPPKPMCPHPGTGGGVSSSTGGGGGFHCATAIPMGDACDLCAESACCGELTACNAVAGCLGCIADPSATACAAGPIHAALQAVKACADGCCTAACYTPPASPCNPVTGAPCKIQDGESCDLSPGMMGGYQCYPAPNDAMLCAPCEESMSPFCAAGLTCLSDGSCAAYCCDDGDCGSGKCDKTMLPAMEKTVGVCVHP